MTTAVRKPSAGSNMRKLLLRHPRAEKMIRNLAAKKMLIANPSELMTRAFKIQTKVDGIQPLRPNGTQQIILKAMREQRRRTGKVRLIILKARQQGASTVVGGIIFGQATTHNNTMSLIVAHDMDGAENLFDKQKIFYQYAPDHLKLKTKYSNRKELVFEDPEWKWNSRIMVDTSSNLEAGRSYTAQVLHCSEVAFYKKGKELMTSLLQSIPDADGTAIFLESTANGVGGFFYRKWKEAKEGKSDYVAIFIPWFISSEYRRAVPEPLELQGVDGAPWGNEEELKEKYNLDEEQLAWRRYAIREKCDGSLDMFKQEYPCNDEECFLTTGRNYFDIEAVEDYRKRCSKPRRVELVRGDEGIEVRSARNTPFGIWHEPKPGQVYTIGADVAEGKDDGDYSSAHVYDKETQSIVARYHSQVSPDLFARDLDLLGRYYNNAWLGVEANNHGLTVLTELRKHLRYPWLYYRRQLNRRTNKTTNELGWHTNVKTKPLVCDKFAAAVRNGDVGIPDEDLLDEARTFIVWPDGTLGAEEGCFDDRVLSGAIGWWLCLEAPKNPVRTEGPKEGTLEAWLKQMDQKDRRRRRLRA